MRVAGWLLTVLSGLALAVGVRPAAAQDESAPEAHAFRPFVSAGLSQFVGDLGEGNRFATGPTVRGGVQTPGSAVALGLSYWSDVNRLRLVSLQLEFVQDLTSRQRLTPNLFVAVGHTWRSHPGTGTDPSLSGTSGAFGLGVEATITPRVLVVADVRLRTDAGGWNGEWRLAGQLTSDRPLTGVESRRSSFVASWMTPFAGPWISVEPAWGLRVVRDGGVLALHLVHWRIPSEGSPGGDRWDTRAVVASAQTQRDLVADHLRLRIGPAVTAMGEGPDDGINFGGLIDLVLGLDVADLRVETTAGWLLVRRSGGSDSSNQHGIMWSVGVGL